jgi:4-hydroxybenzoyl-CoA thioesterase
MNNMTTKKDRTKLVGPELMTWPLPYSVPFSDVDHAGIVFFPRVFTYCHLAYEAWYHTAMSEPFSTTFQSGGVATPVVATDATFESPMRHGDHIVLNIHGERIGNRSFTLGYRISGTDGVYRCTIRVTHAAVSYPTFAGIELPESFRTALSTPVDETK